MTETTGPGWGNICRDCFGSRIDWPGIRRCNCGTDRSDPEPFPKSRALIAQAIEDAILDQE